MPEGEEEITSAHALCTALLLLYKHAVNLTFMYLAGKCILQFVKI